MTVLHLPGIHWSLHSLGEALQPGFCLAFSHFVAIPDPYRRNAEVKQHHRLSLLKLVRSCVSA